MQSARILNVDIAESGCAMIRSSRSTIVLRVSLFLLCALLLPGWPISRADAASSAGLPAAAARLLKDANDVKQAIVVMRVGSNKSRVDISAYQLKKGKWQRVYQMDGYIGKNGFAAPGKKKEGDGKSPSGLYKVGFAFGKYKDPGTELPYRRMTAKHVWVDDPRSKLYNTLQQLPVKGRWKSAETMLRNDKLYDYGFVINYNTDKPQAGKGSAIFFHIASGATLGCTGTSKENVLKLLRWLDPDAAPVIVQNPV